jgi:hypothetical protein
MNKKYTSIFIFGILILATAGVLAYSIHKKETLIAPYTIPVASPVPVKNQTSKPEFQNKNAPPLIPLLSTRGEEHQTPASTSFITVVAGELKVGIPYIENETFYSALVSAQKSGLLTFVGREYSELGFFVSDIGTLHSGEGKNLLYYINGKEASVGVSTYVPKNGDVVEWRLN